VTPLAGIRAAVISVPQLAEIDDDLLALHERHAIQTPAEFMRKL
jgi:hypothetical protein